MYSLSDVAKLIICIDLTIIHIYDNIFFFKYLISWYIINMCIYSSWAHLHKLLFSWVWYLFQALLCVLTNRIRLTEGERWFPSLYVWKILSFNLSIPRWQSWLNKVRMCYVCSYWATKPTTPDGIRVYPNT